MIITLETVHPITLTESIEMRIRMYPLKETLEGDESNKHTCIRLDQYTLAITKSNCGDLQLYIFCSLVFSILAIFDSILKETNDDRRS